MVTSRLRGIRGLKKRRQTPAGSPLAPRSTLTDIFSRCCIQMWALQLGAAVRTQQVVYAATQALHPPSSNMGKARMIGCEGRRRRRRPPPPGIFFRNEHDVNFKRKLLLWLWLWF